MSSITSHKIEAHRRLCIKKDLHELGSWTDMLENSITELGQFLILEKQLIKSSNVSAIIQAMRRKIVLNLASMCKYGQELKKEYEYGNVEYNLTRSNHHEQKRQNYLQLMKELSALKNNLFGMLTQYQRK